MISARAHSRRRSRLVVTAAGAALVGSLAGAGAGAAVGCGGSNDDAPPVIPLDDGGQVDAGSVSFDGGGHLTVAPNLSMTIGLHATEDGPITVWLDGAYDDASLASGTVTAVNGVASIVLRTPSTAAMFALHARLPGGAPATTTVSVSSSGFSAVNVHATYEGVRTVGPVVASVFVDSSCAALLKRPLVDGTLATDGTVNGPVELTNVPADVAVAISVRIGHYASGCGDLPSTTAGAARDVTIKLTDLPAALATTNLDLVFTPMPTTTTVGTTTTDERVKWTAILTRARQRADAAFAPVATEAGEAATLLDTMQAGVAAGQASLFTASRQAHGWDGITTSWLAMNAPTTCAGAPSGPCTALRDRADTWMAAAEPQGLGTLDIHLGGASTDPGFAPATVTSFAGLSAAASGMSIPAPLAWTAESTDDVNLSGGISLLASQLLTSLAALTDGAGTDVPTALASSIDCIGLGAELAGTTTSFGTCDATCTASLCTSALAAMWKSAAGASLAATDITEISMNFGGKALVDDNAVPIHVSGTSVDKISASTGDSTLHSNVVSTQ